MLLLPCGCLYQGCFILYITTPTLDILPADYYYYYTNVLLLLILLLKSNHWQHCSWKLFGGHPTDTWEKSHLDVCGGSFSREGRGYCLSHVFSERRVLRLLQFSEWLIVPTDTAVCTETHVKRLILKHAFPVHFGKRIDSQDKQWHIKQDVNINNILNVCTR